MNTNSALSWRQAILSAVLVAFVGMVITLPTTARAQAFQNIEAPCPQDIAQEIQRQVSIIQPRLVDSVKPAADSWMQDQGGLLDKLSICVGNFDWRVLYNIQLPTLDAILEALIQAAIRRVCGLARDAVRNVDSIFGGGGYYLNSPIPGMGRIGGQVGVGSTGQNSMDGPASVGSLQAGVNGNPASFYVHVPTNEEWQRILPPAAAPAIEFVPAQENQP